MADKRAKHDAQPEITARPRSLGEELTTRPVSEPGLSVDPEDLGRQFLSDATQQGNFESSEGGDTTELSITAEAPSDDPLTGPAFEQEGSVWESSVELSLEEGGSAEAMADASPAGTEQNQGLSPVSQEIDLTGDSVQEASLLDEEAGELGEVESPDVRADTDAQHRRGPFSPSGRRSGAAQ
jgi:hypothetical protein